MKIAIIGMGHVGSALAFALVLKGLGNHLILANRNIHKAQADELDLKHALAFCERSMIIESRRIDQVIDTDILVISASTPLTAGLTSRLQLGPKNVSLFRQIIPVLATNNPEAIFIIISNPVDVLTYLVSQLTGFPACRILGIGTLVDSARFRAGLSTKLSIHPNDLRAYILGEHGPNQFPVFSNASAGSEKIPDNPLHREIFKDVNNAGFEVVKRKGHTNYAISAATCEVIQSIVYDDHRTMPLATAFNEWQGINDNCFSIPVVVGRAGIIRHLQPGLNRAEKKSLEKTAALVKTHINLLLNSTDPGQH